MHTSKKIREKISKANKRCWQDPDYVAKLMKTMHVCPNRQEQLLNGVLQELFPNQYKYTGDGQSKDFIIGGKIPDFVHIKLLKIIEVYGDYWHSEKKTGKTRKEEEQRRITYFAKYGYQTLIVWECELKDMVILKVKLLNFNAN